MYSPPPPFQICVSVSRYFASGYILVFTAHIRGIVICAHEGLLRWGGGMRGLSKAGVHCTGDLSGLIQEIPVAVILFKKTGKKNHVINTVQVQIYSYTGLSLRVCIVAVVVPCAERSSPTARKDFPWTPPVIVAVGWEKEPWLDADAHQRKFARLLTYCLGGKHGTIIFRLEVRILSKEDSVLMG